MTVRYALISVSDKSGVVEFARSLIQLGFTILSTGGTARFLLGQGVAVTEVAQITGFPEILDGRVKTLHPAVHAGILARRDAPEHLRALAQHAIGLIDVVAVNLYPFEATVARPGCTLHDAIENIDVGGPAMLRAAAKNHGAVAVVVEPADYSRVVEELQALGTTSASARFELAIKAFAHTARYDGAISSYLSGIDADGKRETFPRVLTRQWTLRQSMRYGENPHQQAAFYRDPEIGLGLLAGYEQLQGKELSFNNVADADAAWECVRSLPVPACAIVKHANPCGVALGADPQSAYQRAFATDPTSAFGGIIAFNSEVSAECAQAVSQQFAEVIIAPRFATGALDTLSSKGNLRLLAVQPGTARNDIDFKRIGGGLLAQTPDIALVSRSDLKVVTRKAPTEAELDDLIFAFTVVRHVKSNAIVFVRDRATVGIGAGQMSRLDSARIAVIKARDAGLSLSGSAAASDAFFPFRDALDAIVQAGARCVIQPGGSLRDPEVIAAADQHGVAMVFTGTRHFRH
ncbi:MAG TPA: bifunctional phosphoribosylaminoimidazolecarboxamide formyltransferase/IMP cyclohydrolase [Burkholderiaceae bacterium]|jgi:phosphoribosylaminoimidazolecarboxamide formyltransferase/IMP cyclohydrolase|nr:bifunctional phosphoribosylaminoimidazolecarboxamide formyltransferase/IMP cyclohydrolase [Burkholderiaceae bacterium]